MEGQGRRDRDDRDPPRGDGRARGRDHARLGADRLNRRAFAVAGLALLGSGCGAVGTPPPPQAGSPATVERVTDGDTVLLVDGRRVRLVQIDAPELFGECYGEASFLALRHLLPPGTRVRLVRDPSLDDRDEFGRLLRYVTIGGSNVNVELVRRGGAAPYFYRKTRGRHADALERAVEGSVAAGRGLWGACPQTRLNPQRRLDTGPS